MIEVEKKIEITPTFLKYVTSRGKFLGQSVIYDVYFDKEDYHYTLQNAWLRKRMGAFELKRAVRGNEKSVDRYEEITDLPKILEVLKIESYGNFEDSLRNSHINPFAKLTTVRDKYEIDNLIIDIDAADFGDWQYTIAEIECLVSSESEIPKAEQNIQSFIKLFRIDLNKKPLAKLTAYLAKKQPKHFSALRNAGII